MSEVTFKITKEEAQFILNAVAQFPYAQTVNLIDKLVEQTNESLSSNNSQIDLTNKSK